MALVLKMELHSARTGEVTELSTAIITNISGPGRRADYRVRLCGTGRNSRRVWREGFIQDYPRLSLSPWNLVLRCVQAALRAPIPDHLRRKGRKARTPRPAPE